MGQNEDQNWNISSQRPENTAAKGERFGSLERSLGDQGRIITDHTGYSREQNQKANFMMGKQTEREYNPFFNSCGGRIPGLDVLPGPQIKTNMENKEIAATKIPINKNEEISKDNIGVKLYACDDDVHKKKAKSYVGLERPILDHRELSRENPYSARKF